MNLQQIRALGAISTRPLVPKTITFRYPEPLPVEQWTDAETPAYPDQPEMKDGVLDTLIRKRSASDFYELLRAPPREQACVAILRCVCDTDGNPVFGSVEQIDNLADWLFVPLLLAVNEVNSAAPKFSAPKTKSGAISLSPSGGVRSKSGSRRSRKTSG